MSLAVGLDIGRSSIKMVTVRTSIRSFQIVEALEQPLPPDPKARNPEALKEIVRNFLESRARKGEFLCASLRGEKASVHSLNFPFYDKKKIEKVIPFEIESFVPFPLEGMVVAHQIVEKSKTSSKALAVVVPEKDIEEVLSLLSPLEPQVIDLDLFALFTLAQRLYAEDSGSQAIVDMGATRTLVLIIQDGKPVSVKAIPLGGDAVTQSVAGRLRMSFEDAERVKIDFCSAIDVQEGLNAAPESDAFAVSESIMKGVDPILKEIKRAILAVEGREKIKIGKISLTGGAARVLGMDGLVSGRVGIESRMLDLGEIPLVDQASRPSFSLALGLALRAMRGPGSTINLRIGRFAPKKEAKEIVKRLLPDALPFSIVLVFALASLITHYSINFTRLSRLDGEMKKIATEIIGKEPLTQDPVTQAKRRLTKAKQRLSVLGGAFSPLDFLRQISTVVPGDLEFRIIDLAYEPERVQINGRASSYDEVEKIKEALLKVQTFTVVEVANQTKDEEGIGFILTIEMGSKS